MWNYLSYSSMLPGANVPAADKEKSAIEWEAHDLPRHPPTYSEAVETPDYHNTPLATGLDHRRQRLNLAFDFMINFSRAALERFGETFRDGGLFRSENWEIYVTYGYNEDAWM